MKAETDPVSGASWTLFDPIINYWHLHRYSPKSPKLESRTPSTITGLLLAVTGSPFKISTGVREAFEFDDHRPPIRSEVWW
jgi:hypothetical protein